MNINLRNWFGGQIRRRVWLAFVGMAVLFLLAFFKSYSDLRELGIITDAINELNGVAVSIEYMQHDNNAFLLGHAEHAVEFEDHAARAIKHWEAFQAFQDARGGVSEAEKPLFTIIDTSIEQIINNSRLLFAAFEVQQHARANVIVAVEQLSGAITSENSIGSITPVFRKLLLLLAQLPGAGVTEDENGLGGAYKYGLMLEDFGQGLAILRTEKNIAEAFADLQAAIGELSAASEKLEEAWSTTDAGG